MSRHRIVLTIDCNAKTCGRCEYSHTDNWCDIYGCLRGYDDRDPECLRAEKGAAHGRP